MIKHLTGALLAGAFFASTAAQASVVELELTGTWTSADFDVSSTGTDSPSDPTIEENDDLVFGIAPSDGSISFTLLVDTSSVSTHLVGGPDLVQHDFFGYTDVSLKSPVTLGTATWNTAGISTGLIGPGGVGAALWTDTDITSGDPTLVSFRMFGEWVGTGGTGNADMFFGPRIAPSTGLFIDDSFLTWEYFGGEEIRSNSYSASVNPVPLPASSLFLIAGIGGLVAMKRKKKAA